MRLPIGFRAGGVAAGIKPAGLDLAIVAADEPIAAAAVFTTSAAPAAPVQLSRTHVANGRARAVVLNSGCANAATGPLGAAAASRTAATAGRLLSASVEDILVCSTGIIGTELPIAAVERALPGLIATATEDGLEAAAEAIMTTDTRSKLAAQTEPYVVGIAKGAGMIQPHMATMLSVVLTDAAVEADVLDAALRRAVDVSFNALTVDGCMSTNDTVVALASGRAEGPTDLDLFEENLSAVCLDLARQIAADGEGATKQVTVEVGGAASFEEARRLALAVANSALVRSSFAAADPNWGRVMAALGAAGHDPSHASIAYDGIEVARDGIGLGVDPSRLRSRLSGDFVIHIDVGAGAGTASVFTCDLTPGYVVENMETS